MPPASQTIEFEGYFAEGVLGIFQIIHGFANLWDLATASVPYKLSDGAGAVCRPPAPIERKERLGHQEIPQAKRQPAHPGSYFVRSRRVQ